MATETHLDKQKQQCIQHLKDKINRATNIIEKEDTTRNNLVETFLKSSMHAQRTNPNLFHQAKATFERSSARMSFYKKKLQNYCRKLRNLQRDVEPSAQELENITKEPNVQTELQFDEQNHDEKSVMTDHQCINSENILKEVNTTKESKQPALDSSQSEVSTTELESSDKYTFDDIHDEIHALRRESQVLWLQLQEVWGGFSDETERLWGSLREVTQQRNNLEAKVFELAQRHIIIVDEMRNLLDDIEVEREVDNKAELREALERCLVRLEHLEENAEKSKPEKVTKMMVVLGLLEPIIFLFKMTLLTIIHIISIVVSFFSNSDD